MGLRITAKTIARAINARSLEVIGTCGYCGSDAALSVTKAIAIALAVLVDTVLTISAIINTSLWFLIIAHQFSPCAAFVQRRELHYLTIIHYSGIVERSG